MVELGTCHLRPRFNSWLRADFCVFLITFLLVLEISLSVLAVPVQAVHFFVANLNDYSELAPPVSCWVPPGSIGAAFYFWSNFLVPLYPHSWSQSAFLSNERLNYGAPRRGTGRVKSKGWAHAPPLRKFLYGGKGGDPCPL